MDQFAVWKEIGLFLLAIYAAVLSTFNFRQARKKDIRAIKLTMQTAVPTYGPELGPPFVHLQATNSGHRSVSVTFLALRTPNGKRIVSMQKNNFPGASDTKLPAKLAEGESASLYMSYEDVARAMMSAGFSHEMKLTPVCEDSLGASYEGKPWSVDPHEWIGMR